MIYAIEAIGLDRVKFGRAKNPKNRLDAFATGSPVPLRLLAVAEWPDDHEWIIHDAFSTSRAGGEWFHMTYPVGEFVQTLICPNSTFSEKYRACMDILAEAKSANPPSSSGRTAGLEPASGGSNPSGGTKALTHGEYPLSVQFGLLEDRAPQPPPKIDKRFSKALTPAAKQKAYRERHKDRVREADRLRKRMKRDA